MYCVLQVWFQNRRAKWRKSERFQQQQGHKDGDDEDRDGSTHALDDDDDDSGKLLDVTDDTDDTSFDLGPEVRRDDDMRTPELRIDFDHNENTVKSDGKIDERSDADQISPLARVDPRITSAIHTPIVEHHNSSAMSPTHHTHTAGPMHHHTTTPLSAVSNIHTKSNDVTDHVISPDQDSTAESDNKSEPDSNRDSNSELRQRSPTPTPMGALDYPARHMMTSASSLLLTSFAHNMGNPLFNLHDVMGRVRPSFPAGFDL